MKPPDNPNILICSFHKDCGLEEIRQIILGFLPNARIHIAFDFFSVYSTLKHFDYIFLSRRNVLSLTDKQTKINKYIEDYNCWSLFASLIIPFEDSYEQKYKLMYNFLYNLETIFEIDNKNNKLSGFMNSNYNTDLYKSINSPFCFP